MNTVPLSLDVQTGPDFSMGTASGSPTSQIISAGQTADFGLVFSPMDSFAGTVSLTCAVTPAVTPGPTCGLSSESLGLSGGGTQTVTVEIATTAPAAAVAAPQITFPAARMPLAWTLMFLGSAFLWVRSRERLTSLAASVMVMGVVFALGCGGGNSSSTHTTSGTPSGTYTATITATSGNLNHSTTFTVVVR